MQLKEIWNKVRHEASLAVPAIREGLGAMNSHRGLIGFLALTTVFGAAAGHGAPHEIPGLALTGAGWLSLPYCWGRAILSRNSGGESPAAPVAPAPGPGT